MQARYDRALGIHYGMDDENIGRMAKALMSLVPGKKGDDEAEAAEPPSDVRHSPDFRSVLWYGTTYSFTANQSPVVRLLYENWKSATPDVGDETLLLAVDPEAPPARLSNLFRDHPAWGTMIVAGGSKATHRLSGPAQEKP
jgi:hypothetical protein